MGTSAVGLVPRIESSLRLCPASRNYHHREVGLRVFLSYGRDEYAGAADRIRQLLADRGHEVWFDRERLKPGADWEMTIERGIDWVAEARDEGRVVLVMTPHSVRRPDGYCLNELAHALNRHVLVVPVMLVSVEPPLSISRLQWLDMTDCVPLPERQAAFDEQVNMLADALEHGEVALASSDPRERLAEILQPISFDYEMRAGLAGFWMRSWMIDAVDAWLATPQGDPIFWLRGGVGTGKTTIALWLAANRAEFGAWHFCKYGHSAKADARRCVLSLAYQLSTQLPGYYERLVRLNLKPTIDSSPQADELFDGLVLGPLTTMTPPNRTIVAIVDALDEATVDGRNELVDLISSFRGEPPWLRFLVTGRPVTPITGALRGARQLDLDAHEDEAETDLTDFVSYMLKRTLPEERDTAAAAAAIVERASGSFLYARAALDDIGAGRLRVGHLAELPAGLSAVFWRLFERQFPDRTRYAERIRPLMELLAAARGALPLDLIAALLAWGPYDETDVLSDVGSLCVIADRKVEPFHSAVVEWMTNRELAGDYWVSEDRGSERLAAARSDIGAEQAPAVSAYIEEHLPEHLADVGRFAAAAVELADYGRLRQRLQAAEITLRSPYYSRIVRLAAAWPADIDVGPLHDIVEHITNLGWAQITNTWTRVPSTYTHDRSQDFDRGKYALATAVLLVGDLAAINRRLHQLVPSVVDGRIFGFLRSHASEEGFLGVISRWDLVHAVDETTDRLRELGYPGASEWEVPPREVYNL